MKKLSLLFALLCAAALLLSLCPASLAEETEVLDYALPENWAYYELGEDKPVDVFLICPTVDTRSPTNAFDLNEKIKGRFVGALDGEKGIYEETGRITWRNAQRNGWPHRWTRSCQPPPETDTAK